MQIDILWLTQIEAEKGSESNSFFVIHILIGRHAVLHPGVEKTGPREGNWDEVKRDRDTERERQRETETERERETEREGRKPFRLLVFAEADAEGGFGMIRREDRGDAHTLSCDDSIVESHKVGEDALDGERLLVSVVNELDLKRREECEGLGEEREQTSYSGCPRDFSPPLTTRTLSNLDGWTYCTLADEAALGLPWSDPVLLTPETTLLEGTGGPGEMSDPFTPLKSTPNCSFCLVAVAEEERGGPVVPRMLLTRLWRPLMSRFFFFFGTPFSSRDPTVHTVFVSLTSSSHTLLPPGSSSFPLEGWWRSASVGDLYPPPPPPFVWTVATAAAEAAAEEEEEAWCGPEGKRKKFSTIFLRSIGKISQRLIT
jgi:hypothetical protein